MDHSVAEAAREFIEGMLATGQYKAWRTAKVRSNVGGEMENVMCLIFASTEQVAEVVEARIGEPTMAERAGLPPVPPSRPPLDVVPLDTASNRT
jgi:hypothetical protein